MQESHNDNSPEDTDAESLVVLRCKCGKDFAREKLFVDKYEEYKVKYPSAARFYKRKIDHCDPCMNIKMQEAFKLLPSILKSL
jgi:hypothetical protein